MLDARKGLDPDDPLGEEADLLRGGRAGALLVGIRPGLPGHQVAAEAQHRGGVLDEDGKWGKRAGADEIQVTTRPLLYTRARDGRVSLPGGRDRALQESALAAGALDEHDGGLGERHSQGQARKSRAGTDVGDRPSGADDVELERRERVGRMDVHRTVGVAHGRRGVVVVAQHLQQPREALALVMAETVDSADLVQSRRPVQGRGA